MHILYLHQYFKTPEEGGAIRSWYIASELAKAGHEVDLISGGNFLTYQCKEIQGFRVHYLPVGYDNSMEKFQRVLSFIRFFVRASLLSFRLKKFDKIYATSTPLSVGLIAFFLKWMKGIPYIVEVRDLWPDAPIQLGYIRNPVFIRLLYWVEKLIYRNAESIVALSPGIASGIQNKTSGKKILVVPNMSDCEQVKFSEKIPALEDQYGVRGKLVISYTGAIGFSNHLEYLLQGAKICQDHALPIHFLVAGEGSERGKHIKEVEHLKLKNIQFLGHLNKKDMEGVLNITDAVYISFAPFSILETNSPNKFFDGLSAGKVIITNTKGWIKELIETNSCGFYYNPENVIEFLQKINVLLSNRDVLDTQKKNARKLGEERFSVEKLTKEIEELFHLIK